MKKGIKFNASEIQSGLSRVKFAELLIVQLPTQHEGRNSWLLSYGTDMQSDQMRKDAGLVWDDETWSAKKFGDTVNTSLSNDDSTGVQSLQIHTIVKLDFVDRLKALFGRVIEVKMNVNVLADEEIKSYNASADVKMVKTSCHFVKQDRPNFGWSVKAESLKFDSQKGGCQNGIE